MASPESRPGREVMKKGVAVLEGSAGIASLLLALTSAGIAPAVVFAALGVGALYDARKRFKSTGK